MEENKKSFLSTWKEEMNLSSPDYPIDKNDPLHAKSNTPFSDEVFVIFKSKRHAQVVRAIYNPDKKCVEFPENISKEDWKCVLYNSDNLDDIINDMTLPTLTDFMGLTRISGRY